MKSLTFIDVASSSRAHCTDSLIHFFRVTVQSPTRKHVIGINLSYNMPSKIISAICNLCHNNKVSTSGIVGNYQLKLLFCFCFNLNLNGEKQSDEQKVKLYVFLFVFPTTHAARLVLQSNMLYSYASIALPKSLRQFKQDHSDSQKLFVVRDDAIFSKSISNMQVYSDYSNITGH